MQLLLVLSSLIVAACLLAPPCKATSSTNVDDDRQMAALDSTLHSKHAETDQVNSASISSLESDDELEEELADDVDKRANVFRYGKRAPSVFRYGKRTPSVFRYGKRAPSVFRYGKRASTVFRYGKRFDLDSFGVTRSAGTLQFVPKRIFRYGKRNSGDETQEQVSEFNSDLLAEAAKRKIFRYGRSSRPAEEVEEEEERLGLLGKAGDVVDETRRKLIVDSIANEREEELEDEDVVDKRHAVFRYG